jgi:hypothetical protein
MIDKKRLQKLRNTGPVRIAKPITGSREERKAVMYDNVEQYVETFTKRSHSASVKTVEAK